MNGSANGSLKANGAAHKYKPRYPRPPRQKGFFAWVASIAIRLTLWWTVYTAVFNCPASLSELGPNSSVVCKPYLQARSVLDPYLEPHYNKYLKPYVDQARPHVENFDRKVYTPASAFAKKQYGVYGAPRVSQARLLAEQQWASTVKPQLDSARVYVDSQYQKTLGPHVKTTSDALAPYYRQAKASFEDTYDSTLVPAYTYLEPHARKAYANGHHVTSHVILPYLHSAEKVTLAFLNRKLWPQLVILYGKNVEPQLMKISERLGRYKDGKKIEAAFEAANDSTSSEPILSAASSLSVSASSAVESLRTSQSVVSEAAEPAVTAEANVREKIETDLQTWQEKFTKAADKGAEDLQERVDEIINRQVKSQANTVGEALVIRLEDRVDHELRRLKAKINKLVKDLPEEATDDDLDTARTHAVAEVRSAGGAIRQKAQAVREWKQNYDNETSTLVEAALHSTLDVIDSIRDLGLQEIGMRWAGMEDVTYQDWSKYHELKKTFDHWRIKIESVAHDHQGLEKARREGDAVQEQAMVIAEKAALELTRLKEVANWKVEARDTSEDFSSKALPPKAAKAAQAVVDKIKEAYAPSSQGAAASLLDKLADAVDDVKSSASSFVNDVTTTISKEVEYASSEASPSLEAGESSISAIMSAARAKASNMAAVINASAESVAGTVLSAPKSKIAQAASEVLGTPQPSSSLSSASSSVASVVSSLASSASDAVPAVAPNLKSAASVASSVKSSASSIGSVVASSGSDVASAASSSVKSVPSAASQVASSASSFASRAAEFANAGTEDVSQAATSLGSTASSAAAETASSVSSAVSSASSSASAKVWGGAMAAHVEEKHIVLDHEFVDEDDSDTYSARLQSFLNAAGDRASDLTAAISEALQSATTTQGTVESATSIASAQYLSALSAASSILYGTEPGVFESLSSAASDRYQQAVTAASWVVYGTPTPVLQSFSARASSQYDYAVSAAKVQYDAAVSKASLAVSGTPKPAYASLLSSLDSSYSSALSAASYRYSSLLASTTGFTNPLARPTQGALESISSMASARLQEGLSQAAAQYTSAKIAVGAQPAPLHQRYMAEAQRRYYEGVGIAHDRYSSFVDAASTAVYGTPTPVYQRAASSVSNAVYGTPAPAFESLLSVAQNSYSAAVAVASARLNEVADAAKSPAKNVLAAANSQYSIALASASSALGLASSSASVAVYGTPVPAYESLLSAARVRYSSVSLLASNNFNDVLRSASSVAGKKSKSPVQSVLDSASKSYYAALSDASAVLSSASASASAVIYGTEAGNVEYMASVASTAIYGTETPWTEAMASKAQVNWEALVAKASEQVYGQPTPWYESSWSQAGDYAAQATDVAASQYAALQAIVGDILIGREPDFTESVMSRFSSAYYVAAPSLASSASSYASEAYQSASSVISSVFTPPPTLEAILQQASDQLNSAVEAASVQIYGTEKGYLERATEAAGSAYADAASKAGDAASGISGAVYGTPTGYIEAAQSNFEDLAGSASAAISQAIYGTPTGTIESAANAAGNVYTSLSSAAADSLGKAGQVVGDSYSSVAGAVSGAIYGPEAGAVESAQQRVLAAVESARSRIASMQSEAAKSASSLSSVASKSASSVVSAVSSAASSVSSKVKDEL